MTTKRRIIPTLFRVTAVTGCREVVARWLKTQPDTDVLEAGWVEGSTAYAWIVSANDDLSARLDAAQVGGTAKIVTM